MMKTTKVILWGRVDLFSSSVEFLLATQKKWDVVNISDEEGVDALILAIETMEPDVLIIPQGLPKSISLWLFNILMNYPNLRMISISPENNAIEIYSKKQVWVKSVTDLVTVVEEGVPENVQK